ncbi:hypothetical protein [Microcoleus sp.]|uniref:hypothetical protein n=1 Tax=Microcoleus sp. TaxID=44472 RepID=UPI0035931145
MLNISFIKSQESKSKKMNLRHGIQLPKLLTRFWTSSCFVSKKVVSNSRQRLSTIGYSVPSIAVALAIAIPISASAETLRVGVAGSPPFVIRQDNRVSGISVEIWKLPAPKKSIINLSLNRASKMDLMQSIARN